LALALPSPLPPLEQADASSAASITMISAKLPLDLLLLLFCCMFALLFFLLYQNAFESLFKKPLGIRRRKPDLMNALPKDALDIPVCSTTL
jgi:hypothetical protein